MNDVNPTDFNPTGWTNPVWRQSKALILGAGESGFAAADTLIELGVTVTVLAENVSERLDPLFDVIGARLIVGNAEEENLALIKEFDPDFAIISPSFPDQNKLVQGLKLRQNPIWSEAELAWRLRDKFSSPADWVQITGTMTPQVLQIVFPVLDAAEITFSVYGADQPPILDGIRGPMQPDLFFVIQNANQLSALYSSEPVVSVYTDSEGKSWHGEDHEKIAALGRVYGNTRDFAIYPAQDDFGEFLLERADVIEGCRAIGYSLLTPDMSQIGIVEDLIVDRAFIDDRRDSALEICTMAEVQAFGVTTHKELSELLAAIAIVRALGVSDAVIRQQLFGA